ncbi:MAG: ABC transporter permease [Clostridia bacterium]|nr:ABC transporter permease [Clostridia bacterium]
MLKYVLKRLLLMIPILLGVIFIVFTIMNFTPGTPGRTILGMSATQEQVDQLNHELGYDRPFFERFVRYCGDLLQGDLGSSYRTRQPFVTELAGRLPTTLRVGGIAFVISSVLGILLGVLAAAKQYSFIDTFSSVTAILFASVPAFFLGMVLIYVFGLTLGWFPTFGLADWKGYVLPVVSLSLATLVSVQRLTRTTMLEAVRCDFVRTAKAKGCTKGRIIWKHAFKNAVLPVITVLGINAGTVFGGAVVVESVYQLPGMGTYILTAIRSKDIPVVMSSTIVLSLFFCLAMILVDILYAAVDPRIRERMTR